MSKAAKASLPRVPYERFEEQGADVVVEREREVLVTQPIPHELILLHARRMTAQVILNSSVEIDAIVRGERTWYDRSGERVESRRCPGVLRKHIAVAEQSLRLYLDVLDRMDRDLGPQHDDEGENRRALAALNDEIRKLSEIAHHKVAELELQQRRTVTVTPAAKPTAA